MKAKWNTLEPGLGSFQGCCGVSVGLSVRMGCHKCLGKSVQTALGGHALTPLVEDVSRLFPLGAPTRTLDVWLGKASEAGTDMYDFMS